MLQLDNNNITQPSNLYKHNGHEFRLQLLTSPAFCAYCSNFLWGITKQGVKCQNCSLVAHFKCYEKFEGICSMNKDNVKFLLLHLISNYNAINNLNFIFY